MCSLKEQNELYNYHSYSWNSNDSFWLAGPFPRPTLTHHHGNRSNPSTSICFSIWSIQTNTKIKDNN